MDLNNSVILCRKLTWKSIIGFGMYSDCSVQHVFDANHTKYLRWIYYNFSKINFTEEILRAINIREEDEIIKPGKDSEKGIEIDNIVYKCTDWKRKSHIDNVIKRNAKFRDVLENIDLRSKTNTNILTRKNHGHNVRK